MEVKTIRDLAELQTREGLKFVAGHRMCAGCGIFFYIKNSLSASTNQLLLLMQQVVLKLFRPLIHLLHGILHGYM